MRWVLAIALAIAALPRSADAGWDGRRPAVLTLVINEVRYGEALVLLAADDALVEREDLRRAGILLAGARTETIRARRFVSLRSLGVRHVADEVDLTLRVTVPAELLPATRIDLGPEGEPAGVIHEDQRSAFLDYALHAARDADLGPTATTRLDGYGEVGARVAGALALTAVTFTSDRAPVRGTSSVTWDDRDDLRRVIAGDHLVSGGGLGGSAVIGGLHLARAFELDPYLATAPALELRGAVTAPSTAEVYVDGNLVRRIELPPGAYDLSNVPATAGAGVTRVVVRDALGRTQELSSSFYQPAGLLRRGLSDFALSLGVRRERLAAASFAYGDAVAVGRYRRGLSARVTAGVRGEATPGLASGGLAVACGSRFGQLELGLGGSVEGDGEPGGAASLAWAYLGRRGGGSLAVRARSARYGTLDVGPAADRPTLEARLSVTRALGRRSSLGTQAAADLRRDGGRTASAAVSASFTPAAGWVWTTSAGVDHDDLGGVAVHAVVALSSRLGERTRGGVRHEQIGAQERDRVDLHRTIAGGTGVGYRLAGQLGERDVADGELEVRTAHGRYRLGYQQGETGGRVDVAAAGGLALIGGRVFAIRPIERSFVLVRVPDAEGVRVYLDNKEVGRTDAGGDLLVTGALPYYGNKIAIEPADLPGDRPPAWTSMLLAPPDRGGAVAAFAAPRLQVVRGRVRVERGGRRVVPAFGELVIGAPASFEDPESTQWSSPLGREGEFEIEGVTAGSHPAVIEWAGGRCELVLDVPAAGPMVDVGVHVCAHPVAGVRP